MYLSLSTRAARAAGLPGSMSRLQLCCIQNWLHRPSMSTLNRGRLINNQAVSAPGGEADDDDDEPAAPRVPYRVERLLANLGYGKRKECAGLVRSGRVTHVRPENGRIKVGQKVVHSDVLLEGVPLDTPFPMALLLHKPVGYVVTSPDDENIPDPKVYDLLPFRFGRRRPCLACVGRLDKETSGLLLLTDDGQLLHRINSPKKGIWKVYEATLADPLVGRDAEAAARRFESGMLVLKGDFSPLLPARLTMLDPHTARIALCEGKYHQIRRMFAAVGREVTALHRLSIGGLGLSDLPEGQWRYLTPADVEAVFSGPTTDDVMKGSAAIADVDDALSEAEPLPEIAAAGRVFDANDVAAADNGRTTSGDDTSASDNGIEEGGRDGTGIRRRKGREPALAGSVQGWQEDLLSSRAAMVAEGAQRPGGGQLPRPTELATVKKFRDSERWRRRREALKSIMPTKV